MPVGPAKTRRTNKRLARIRLQNPKALPRVKADNKYTPREVRKVRRRASSMKAKAPARKPKAAPYSPLDPLTGPRLRQERKAAERLEFGPRQRELATAERSQDQQTANVGSYYDDYQQALRESTARIKATNEEQAKQAEARVDTAVSQDTAAVNQRDAEASAQAAKLGRGPVVTKEGHQSVEAARSQGNQAVAGIRKQAAADNTLMELRGATSVQAKAEALGRQLGKRAELRLERKDMAADRGKFRADYRAKSRESEREWAAIQKEFGLKSRELKQDSKSSRADRRLEQQKLAAQKIVAGIYAGADRAGARAQIRVAKIQLDKGKIDQKQYREIVNIYRGLPKKGKSGGQGGGGKGGPKSVKKAVGLLGDAHVRADQRAPAIQNLVDKYGYSPRAARNAWREYMKSHYNKPRG